MIGEIQQKKQAMFIKKSQNKKILIYGVTGQDGSLLAREYVKNNFKVFGVLTTKKRNYKNLKTLKIFNKIKILDGLKISTKNIIQKTKCNYIFFLSGLASVTKSDAKRFESITSNNKILIEILEFIREKNLKKIKILNASSSEIYARNRNTNNEKSEINPASYYGLAKSISTEIVRAYRSQFGIKVFNAILFNHESPLRPSEYVIQKIIQKSKKIISKKNNKLSLGNLDVSRDWGWAKEYVYIMTKLIKLSQADDYIISTNQNKKLRDIVKYIFLYHGLNYKKFIYQKKSLFRTYEVNKISGNNKKLIKAIKYKPKIFIKQIINKMINKEY